MSGAPFKKLPASPSVSSPSVPVADRGGEEVNVGFSDFGASSGNQFGTMAFMMSNTVPSLPTVSGRAGFEQMDAVITMRKVS